MTGGDRLERRGQVGERIDALQLAGLDEGGDPRAAVCPVIMAGEEGAFPLQAEGGIVFSTASLSGMVFAVLRFRCPASPCVMVGWRIVTGALECEEAGRPN